MRYGILSLSTLCLLNGSQGHSQAGKNEGLLSLAKGQNILHCGSGFQKNHEIPERTMDALEFLMVKTETLHIMV